MLLCAISGLARASESFQQLLERTDEIRSADAQAFLANLEQLDARLAEATPLQQQHLRFLHSYRRALKGESAAVIAELKSLQAETSDLNLKFRAGLFIVNNHAITREFTEGLIELDKALVLLPQINDRDLRQVGQLTASILYNQAGQYSLARDFAELILAAPGKGRTRCMAGVSRLEALYHLDALPQDDATFDAQIDQCLAEKERLVTSYARSYLARKWASQGQRPRAIALLEQYLGEAESSGYARLIGDFHSLLAEYHFAEGHVEKAESHARLAIEKSRGITFSLPLVVANKTLYEIAAQRGDTAAALAHYRDYAQADKAYLDAVKARELAVQMARHETIQKEQTIELLNKQNEVLQLGEQVARQAAFNSKLLMAFLGLLLASITYWAYRTQRTQIALRRLAETDALTGVSSRHAFTRDAQAALTRWQKTGSPVSLIMFDLDHFKAINDLHGHAIGDLALQNVTRAAHRLKQPPNLLGRLGGEEFAYLLIATEPEAARALAEQCRHAIEAIGFTAAGQFFTVTASFGLSSTRESGYDLQTLLSQADHAAYSSKHAGRNRVTAFAGAVVG